MESTARTNWAFPGLDDTVDITALDAWGDKVGADIGAAAVTSTTRPSSGNYPGRLIHETNTGMIRMWTGSRWRWIGGTPQWARFSLGPQALNTNALSSLLVGAKSAASADPAGIYSAASTAVTVGVAGTYVLSWGLSTTSTPADVSSRLITPTMGTVHGGMLTKGGDSSASTSPAIPMDAGQSVTVQTWVYAGSPAMTVAAGSWVSIRCVSEA